MAYHMYVSNSGSEFLSHFLMDEETGGLTAQPDIDMQGPPGAMANTADEKVMFVCLRSQKQFASFSIDGASGGLTKIGATTAPDGAPYIETDNTDGYLLASYYGAGHVSVHKVNDDGTLSAEPLQYIETDGHAHSIQTDATNRFAYVPHTCPANAIYQFGFDENTGTLTPLDPPFIQPATPEGPRHFVIHPTKNVLYSVNEDGCTVSAHHVDPDKGTLTSFQVLPTMPEGTDMEGMSTAEIKLTSDGVNLYASNRGHNTLAHYHVQEDGSLEFVDRYPCDAVPRFFAIDPTEKFVYSAGQNTGKIVAYRIGDGGALETMGHYDVGDGPLWIQFVKQS